MSQAQRKIIVAMSGGVDSSVAAAILVKEGYEVIGAFMKNWSETKDPITGMCAWREERADAMRVANKLGIPLLTFDFETEYKEAVVGYMLREYAAGRTPNPDVMCNKWVKFDLFLKKALEQGASMIATGHYARVTPSIGHPGAGRDPGTFHLLAGVDSNKDQSYFLHQLNQEQLSKTLFPIGHLQKSEVRKLAEEFGLPNAQKKDSQGICFIGKLDFAEFLSKKIPGREGPIVSVDGSVVGRHQNLAPFTIGQRHGINIGGGAPYFVVGKDVARNTLIVAQEGNEEALYKKEIMVEVMHWIAGQAPVLPLKCQARIRYRQPLQDATIENGRIVFVEPQRAVSPGQFAVFYDGEECLGGGVIA